MGTDGRRPASALRTGGDAARLDDWCDALSASGRGGRKSGGEWVGPCPRCGGQDRFAVKRGRDVEVVVHCRKGCSFHELRQAVFGGVRLPASPCWHQEGRKTARSAYPDLDPNSLDPAGLARALVERLVLTPDWRKSLSRRGLDPNRLAAYGWRSVDSADGWQPLAELPARFGWPPRPSGRPRWPLRLDCGSALFVPLRDRLRDLSGLRFRGGQEWSEDRKARGLKAPKSVGLASVPSQLYGADALATAQTGGVVHIAEGEIDAESLRQHQAAAVGVPGAAVWRPSWTEWIRERRPRRVAIWFDGDEAGDTAGRKLRDRLAGIEVDRLTGIAARDVNDLCVDGDLVNLIEQSEAL